MPSHQQDSAIYTGIWYSTFRHRSGKPEPACYSEGLGSTVQCDLANLFSSWHEKHCCNQNRNSCTGNMSLVYHSLFKDLSQNLKEIIQTTVSLQSQTDSLESVTAKPKKLTPLYIRKMWPIHRPRKVCHFYTNQFGIVQNATKRLNGRAWVIRQY